MGETGPCGPCSEIHLDLGPDACDKQGVAGPHLPRNGDCRRFIELWNLVSSCSTMTWPTVALTRCPPGISIPAWALSASVSVLQGVRALTNRPVHPHHRADAGAVKASGVDRDVADDLAIRAGRLLPRHCRPQPGHLLPDR